MTALLLAHLIVLGCIVAWDAFALYLMSPDEEGAPASYVTPAIERGVRIAVCAGLLVWTAVAGGV